MLNKIMIMGRLTCDPELRTTLNGTHVAAFTLAVERDVKEQGRATRPPAFIDCVAWRYAADFVSRYFTKGRMAVVEGRLQMRDWTDKDGNKRTTAEVVAENVYFGDSKSEGGAARSSAPAYGSRPASAPMNNDFAEIGDEDGELPF